MAEIYPSWGCPRHTYCVSSLLIKPSTYQSKAVCLFLWSLLDLQVWGLVSCFTGKLLRLWTSTSMPSEEHKVETECKIACTTRVVHLLHWALPCCQGPASPGFFPPSEHVGCYLVLGFTGSTLSHQHTNFPERCSTKCWGQNHWRSTEGTNVRTHTRAGIICVPCSQRGKALEFMGRRVEYIAEFWLTRRRVG